MHLCLVFIFSDIYINQYFIVKLNKKLVFTSTENVQLNGVTV